MSEVEQFYVAIQTKVGGTVQWNQLHPLQQQQFVQALNAILQICASQQIFQEETTV